MLLPVLAQAQGVSPGPLSRDHADLDVPTKCTTCHQLSGKTAFAICTSCHSHKPLAPSLEAGRGLHGKFKAQRCETCHTEHKGRDATVTDWSKVGGQTQFDHRVTGFLLKGQHEKVKCTACHKRPTRSGWLLFAGLSPDCDACHKNPHKFTDLELRGRCLDCHVTGGVAPKQMAAGDVPFDHEKVTGVALVAKHAAVRCAQCHKGGNMSMAVTRTCKDCHKNPHTGSQKLYLKYGCPTCHSPADAFKDARFEHRQTDFLLVGQHSRVACKRCHAKQRPAPTGDCAGCHKGTHRDRFAAFKCRQCHTPNAERIAFPHAEAARFPLAARHAQVKCRACHRGAKPWLFEKFPGPECRSCHKHTNAHKGQFDPKQCTACHLEGGSKKLTFDHDKDSRFPLAGAHRALAEAGKCKSCHAAGLYRSGQTACLDCHKDAHGGTLGNDCGRCHSADVPFKKTRFDHGSVRAFKLEGLHAEVGCEKCHPNRSFRTGKTRCFDCHGEKEPHERKLGDACEKCHTPEKRAPLFQHERMTRFARAGRHLEVACAVCHRPPPASPPAVGWAKAVASEPLDLRFFVIGKRCPDCHADPHRGANGTDCASCHKLTSFKDVSVSVHDTGAFRLGGKHASLLCDRCHQPGRLLAGTGEACGLCHRDDDPHGNALGLFCGDCHQQGDWLPSPFSHASAAFPLLGAHRTTPCRRCHGPGTFQGLPSDCGACHASQAAAVADPVHSAELGSCEGCHSPAAFRPARFGHGTFPLVGAHRQAGCANCHLGGRYAGTPDTCESCHLTRYLDPGTQPDHRVLGYGTACGDCHNPVGWRPAVAP